MGYFGYYLAWLALSYVIRQPWLLVGLVGLWLLRGLLPPPGALFGAFGRAGRLREQVRLNRANITARRDLATIYLSVLRPRRALPLLEEGLTLSPEDAELMYLYGVALHRVGRDDEALAQLLAAIEKDARLRHGQPYFVAGDTLLALRRWDDAADAFERYLDFSSSDVAAHTRLARAYAGSGDIAQARKWLLSGLTTWHTLPASLKRRQLGAYFGAQWARVSVLKDPLAIALALLVCATSSAGGYALWPLLARLWRPNVEQLSYERMLKSAKLCGTQRTGDFAGRYEATPEVLEDPNQVGPSRLSESSRRRLQRAMAQRYLDFRIERDRIVSGRQIVQEFCLTKVLERKPGELHAEAIGRWHEAASPPAGAVSGDEQAYYDDDAGPGTLFDVRLSRGSESTRFSFAPLGEPLSQTLLTLRREP